MTKRIGIIGYPLKHSISPIFQQAALDYYGLDARYESWETEPNRVKEVVDGLRRSQDLGMNVTIPHKEVIIPLLDEVDGLAKRIGAVNTIVNQAGHLMGYNTDAPGFLRAIRVNDSFEPRSKTVVMLGAGGAARAISFTLVEAGISALAIFNRNVERAESLEEDLQNSLENKSLPISALPWEDRQIEAALSKCDLIVNCTSIGMRHSTGENQSPLQPGLIPKGALVFDLVYNPAETPLLRQAKKAGAATQGGLPMLVYQGAAAFELWTGKEPPIEVMLRAAREAVGGIG